MESGDIPEDESSEGPDDEEHEISEGIKKITVTEGSTSEVNESSGKKGQKRKFEKIEDSSSDDSLPKRYQHIRVSERKIKDEFYKTVANLAGAGLSLSESSNAVIMVGNGMFDRKWKSQEKY